MQDELLAQWYARVSYFKHLGHQIAYMDNQRDGEALVLLHGFPNSSWDWHRIWPLLDRRYRLIALDFLGCGMSDKPQDHEYSVMDQADQLSRLLGVLGVRQAHLVAHSSGISVAQEILALKELDDDPELPAIRSLVFLNGGVLPSSAPTIMEQRLVQMQGEDVASHLNAAFLHNVMQTLAGTSHVFTEAETAVVWQQMTCNGGVQTMVKLLHYITERQQMGPRWEQAMRITQVPMCAMLGSEDPVWGRSVMEDIRRRMPMMETELLTSVGHYPYWHDAEGLCNALSSFHTACLLKG